MTPSLIALYLICLLVGLLVGGTGMGGILIPPALVLLSGLETHVAMGTTLASFVPMNLVGCYLFRRMNHLDWHQAFPLILGGALSSGPCALMNARLGADFLTILLALLILYAGYSTYKPVKPNKSGKKNWWLSWQGIFGIGFITGTVAGLTGAGGPLLAIAWMVSCGMHPLSAIGLSMPYSLATAFSASVGNYLNGNLDLKCLAQVSTIEFLGFFLGIYLVSKMPVALIKRLMAWTCTLLGLFLLVKSSGAYL
ncbi:MAG: sulfite exporter TauE/SafE family protein [Desulfovibrionaceae bacterium]|nr:sulfite exporter TauE/SafE family protein [Desulfovibrionaceae bacterium]